LIIKRDVEIPKASITKIFKIIFLRTDFILYVFIQKANNYKYIKIQHTSKDKKETSKDLEVSDFY